MALPLLALWLLLARPEIDLAWDDRVAHFVLVLATALVSVVLGGLIGRAARARDDARLWLVSLVFVITVGFFGLHALVTPGVLDRLLDPALVDGAARVAALVGSVLFASAALSYLPIYRRRRAVVVMSVLTAFVLLAEASLALAFAPSWHASWWLWHVLMTLAFCFIAYSAHIQFHRQGSARGLFDSLATQQTIADLRRDYAAALEAMVDVLQRRERGEQVPPGAVAARLAARFDLSEQQVAVLKRGAEALGAEREQVRKLGGLVAVGREASVIQDEDVLLERVMAAAAEAFPRDQLRLGLVRAGELSFAG